MRAIEQQYRCPGSPATVRRGGVARAAGSCRHRSRGHRRHAPGWVCGRHRRSRSRARRSGIGDRLSLAVRGSGGGIGVGAGRGARLAASGRKSSRVQCFGSFRQRPLPQPIHRQYNGAPGGNACNRPESIGSMSRRRAGRLGKQRHLLVLPELPAKALAFLQFLRPHHVLRARDRCRTITSLLGVGVLPKPVHAAAADAEISTIAHLARVPGEVLPQEAPSGPVAVRPPPAVSDPHDAHPHPRFTMRQHSAHVEVLPPGATPRHRKQGRIASDLR